MRSNWTTNSGVRPVSGGIPSSWARTGPTLRFGMHPSSAIRPRARLIHSYHHGKIDSMNSIPEIGTIVALDTPYGLHGKVTHINPAVEDEVRIEWIDYAVKPGWWSIWRLNLPACEG